MASGCFKIASASGLIERMSDPMINGAFQMHHLIMFTEDTDTETDIETDTETETETE